MNKLIKRFLVFTFFLVCCQKNVLAQANSQIFLFDIARTSDTTYRFSAPRLLTQFNPEGYNNQPAFFSDNEIYLSVRMPTDVQTDIYAMDLEKKTLVQVTETAGGEYSPKRTPDYFYFSVVRQEFINGDTIQRLWQLPIDRMSEGKPFFKYINNIGYYQWINGNQVALFLVDNPNRLVVADIRTDEISEVATGVGRDFKVLRNGSLTFVQKLNFGSWALMEVRLDASGKTSGLTKITDTLAGSEDFEILRDGSFIMALGSKIYRYNRFLDEEWREIVDLRFYGIKNITRMAVSPGDKIAIVGTK